MPAPIKLSIITVNLNNANGLSKTLESVASQTFTNYEHIIIDGGSTDGSVAIIKEYEQKYNGVPGHLYWVSEPDKGIYNAMNKGIKVASGEYCLFLNSGDWLVESKGLGTIFSYNPNEHIVYFNIQTQFGIWEYPPKLTLLNFIEGTIGHPASIIKRELFEVIGNYNENQKIISDWEFFLYAIVVHKKSYRHHPYTLTFFEFGGVSLNIKNKESQIIAREAVLEELFPRIIEDYTFIKKVKSELMFYQNSRLIKLTMKLINILNYLKRLSRFKRNHIK